MSQFLSKKFGVTSTIDTDWAREQDSEKLEIIFGTTDHPETASLLDDMKTYGEYIVRAVGNKLIIVSYTEAGYNRAMKHLEKALGRGYDRDTNTITVSTASLNVTEVVDEQLAALPVYEGGTYLTTYDAGRVTRETECLEVIIKQTTSGEYDKYLQKLETVGYTKYTTNDVGKNNKFAIYTNDAYTLNVGYYDYEQAARLLVEPKTTLPTRENDEERYHKYENKEKITTSQITMIAVSQGNQSNGLSTLIRLEDGRFIVVDGSWSDRYAHWEKTIKEQAKDYTDKPIIAAWIITHGHGDHIGLLLGNYHKIKDAGITVERFLFNEVAENQKTDYGIGPTEKVFSSVAPYLGAETYKIHVGQAFYFSNCKIDVVFSQEAYGPNPCSSYNATSTITKMTFTDSATGQETTYLSTGDATGECMKTASDIFGEFVRCDILSTPHHGGSPGAAKSELSEAYKVMAPKLVLFPNGTPMSGRWYNDPLFASEFFKETYYAGERGAGGLGDFIVPLPYVQGNFIRVPQQ